MRTDRAAGRNQNAADRLQERTLAGSVRADDTEHVALLQRERDVLVRIELLDMVVARDMAKAVFLESDGLHVAGDISDINVIAFYC